MREAQRIVGALCFRYLCFVFNLVFFDWVRVHACNRFISFDLGFFVFMLVGNKMSNQDRKQAKWRGTRKRACQTKGKLYESFRAVNKVDGLPRAPSFEKLTSAKFKLNFGCPAGGEALERASPPRGIVIHDS